MQPVSLSNIRAELKRIHALTDSLKTNKLVYGDVTFALIHNRLASATTSVSFNDQNLIDVGTVDGRTLSTDGAKLDLIEAAADVTDFVNVNAALAAADAAVDFNSQDITGVGTVDGRDLATDGSKLDAIEASADVTDFTNVNAALAAADATVDFNNQNITGVGDVDGRDVSVDGSKLDGIELLADVTDFANVKAALAAASSTVNFNTQSLTGVSALTATSNITCGGTVYTDTVDNATPATSITLGTDIIVSGKLDVAEIEHAGDITIDTNHADLKTIKLENGGAGLLQVDVVGTIQCDTFREYTADTGITIESVELKDGYVKPTEGYKSSDGTAGSDESITISAGDTITVKDGLITSYSAAGN